MNEPERIYLLEEVASLKGKVRRLEAKFASLFCTYRGVSGNEDPCGKFRGGECDGEPGWCAECHDEHDRRTNRQYED